MAARIQPSTTYDTTSSETTQALVGRFPDIPSDDPHSTTFLARRCRQPHELGTIGTQVHHLYEHANTALTTTTTIGHARLSATATTTTISAGRDTRDILSYTSTRQTTTHCRISGMGSRRTSSSTHYNCFRPASEFIVEDASTPPFKFHGIDKETNSDYYGVSGTIFCYLPT